MMKKRTSLMVTLAIISIGASSAKALAQPMMPSLEDGRQLYALARARKPVAPIFRSILPQLKRQSRIPILLPSELQVKPNPGQRFYVNSYPEANEYSLYIVYAPDCAGAVACTDGWFHAERGGSLPDGDVRVRLAKGITGYYQPRSYKSPPAIDWVYQGVLYTISLKEEAGGYDRDAKSDANKVKAWLIQVANSAINAGAR
jgi:hypothetical protein